MLSKSLISTGKESELLVTATLGGTIVYTLRPSKVFKLIWKLLLRKDITFVAYSKEGVHGREDSQN